MIHHLFCKLFFLLLVLILLLLSVVVVDGWLQWFLLLCLLCSFWGWNCSCQTVKHSNTTWSCRLVLIWIRNMLRIKQSRFDQPISFLKCGSFRWELSGCCNKRTWFDKVQVLRFAGLPALRGYTYTFFYSMLYHLVALALRSWTRIDQFGSTFAGHGNSPWVCPHCRDLRISHQKQSHLSQHRKAKTSKASSR